MSKPSGLLLCLFCFLAAICGAQTDTITLEPAAQADVHIKIKDYTILADEGRFFLQIPETGNSASITVNGQLDTLPMINNRVDLGRTFDEKGELLLLKNADNQYRIYHTSKTRRGLRVRHIPMWLSIVPPLVAILLALIFREVVVSLFVGVWVGAFIAGGMRIESFYYFLISFWEVVEKYVVSALTDGGHQSIIIFSILIGGMVAVISRNGGMAGVVKSLSKYANSPRSAQFITWLLGVAIFFDDYANTLIVGNTMRSVTDRFRISREKLAYIVDSTAAPVAAVAFITTWIGAELGYIDDGIKTLTDYTGPTTPYALFIGSLKYSFYPVMTLVFILMLIFTGRDFGGMYKAEVRARTTGEVDRVAVADKEVEETEDLSPIKGAPLNWWNAVIPVLTVILVTIYGLIDTGINSTYGELIDMGVVLNGSDWGDVWVNIGATLEEGGGGFFRKVGKLIGNADSYTALLWASLSGVFVAILMTVGGRIMKLGDSITTMLTGFKTMLPAILILTLAWSLAATTDELHTATYLTSALKGSLNPFLVPMIVFILSASIAFSTGSSWSTMAILYPIAIPTTWAVSQAQGVDPDVAYQLLLNVIAVVLAASVLGDHCSPISDTTILSSLASDCNHIDHVRTQLPYALSVGFFAFINSGLSTYLGGGWLISIILFLVSMTALFLIVRQFGKRPPEFVETTGTEGT
jgi:Na+/H+ antiporter NhaC